MGRTFTKHPDGSLLFSLTEGEYRRYEYDLATRMTRVYRGERGRESATERASYLYDPSGLRVSKTAGGRTTCFVYGIDGNELAEIGDTGSLETLWALGKKIAEIETVSSKAPETSYLATDHLGSVVAVTDETGRILWTGEQGAFGEAVAGTGLRERAASYTGKDWDEEAGLYYFNARWYDPSLGRFTTEDPIKDGGNWYAYVSSRPLTLVDPTGLEAGYVTTPNLPVVHHAAVWFGNDKAGYTFAELTGYRKADANDYAQLNKTKIEFPPTEVAEALGFADEGLAGIRIRTFATKDALDAFLDNSKVNFQNRISYSTTADQDKSMLDLIKEKLANPNSDQFLRGYDLFSNNCAGFAVRVLKEAGIDIGEGLPVPVKVFENAVMKNDPRIESDVERNQDIDIDRSEDNDFETKLAAFRMKMQLPQ